MTTDLLRLQAYTGNAAARDAWEADHRATKHPMGWTMDECCDEHRKCQHRNRIEYHGGELDRRCTDCLEVFGKSKSDAEWLAGLLPLYLAAAPRFPCACGIAKCGRPNYASHDPRPDPHALLKLCVKVGWAAGHAQCECEFGFLGTHGDACWAIIAVLKAADAWLKDPTEDRRKALLALPDWPGPPDSPDWVGAPWRYIVNKPPRPSWADRDLEGGIRSALNVIGMETVGRCAVERVSEECSWCQDGLLGACPYCHGTKRVERNTEESDA